MVQCYADTTLVMAGGGEKRGELPTSQHAAGSGENAKHFKLSQAIGSGKFAEKGGGADPT